MKNLGIEHFTRTQLITLDDSEGCGFSVASRAHLKGDNTYDLPIFLYCYVTRKSDI